MVASVPTPKSHKSAKKYLRVAASSSLECPGDFAGLSVTVDSIAIGPDFSFIFPIKCNDEPLGVQSENFFSIAEKDGGPAFPTNAPVDLHASSSFGTATAGVFRSLIVESVP